MLRFDGILIKPEDSTNEGLDGEIGYEGCEPLEYMEPSTRLEHEDRGDLL
jgi:hypothetical protein